MLSLNYDYLAGIRVKQSSASRHHPLPMLRQAGQAFCKLNCKADYRPQHGMGLRTITFQLIFSLFRSLVCMVVVSCSSRVFLQVFPKHHRELQARAQVVWYSLHNLVPSLQTSLHAER